MCTHLALRLRTDPAVSVTAHPSLRAPIHVFSTHYDHKGVVARAKSSDLIVEQASIARRQSRKFTGLEPLIVLAGDLNSPREEQGWQVSLCRPTNYGRRTRSDHCTPLPRLEYRIWSRAITECHHRAPSAELLSPSMICNWPILLATGCPIGQTTQQAVKMIRRPRESRHLRRGAASCLRTMGLRRPSLTGP